MSNNIADLHPYVQEKLRGFLSQAKEEGITLTVTSTFRSREDQDALYEQGRGKPGNIVTNVRYPYSFHNHRVAFDVVPVRDKTPIWNDYSLWEKIGKIGSSLDFDWGGDWKAFPDYGHFHYTGGLSIHDFIKGKTLPLPEKEHVVPRDQISDWALSSWENAKTQGLLRENTHPQDSTTKEELIVFFDRLGLLNNLQLKNLPAHFDTENVSEWAISSWKKAIIRGMVQKNTHPGDFVTKEELMLFLDRAGIFS